MKISVLFGLLLLSQSVFAVDAQSFFGIYKLEKETEYADALEPACDSYLNIIDQKNGMMTINEVMASVNGEEVGIFAFGADGKDTIKFENDILSYDVRGIRHADFILQLDKYYEQTGDLQLSSDGQTLKETVESKEGSIFRKVLRHSDCNYIRVK